MKWRVESKCENCGREWTTKAKDSATPPTRCSGEEGCGSYDVEGISADKVVE